MLFRSVNIDLPINYQDYLDGHVILGHIHEIGKIIKIINLENSTDIWIKVKSYENLKFKDSICVDGISLTIAEIIDNSFRVSIIPHTLKNTNLQNIKVEDIVNIEYNLQLNDKKTHEYYMNLALKEGKKGKSTCSPNPWVGAILVKNGKIIGKGYHKKAGTDHAEILAIKDSKECENSTLYCTLEPCSWFEGKRTPACVDRIIKEKINTIVIGMLDPDNRVAKRCIEKFQSANINVIMIEDCYPKLYEKIKLNFKEYIHHRITGNPYITVKIALTADGCYAFENQKKWITHKKTREKLYKFWMASQAIIIGAKTVFIDNEDLENIFAVEKYQFNFYKIIIDGKCLIPKQYKIFSDKTYIITDNALKWKDFNIKTIEINNTYDIKLIIEKIKQIDERIINIMIEGGGKLQNSFFENGLVNEILIFRGSKIFGLNGIRWNEIGRASCRERV